LTLCNFGVSTFVCHRTLGILFSTMHLMAQHWHRSVRTPFPLLLFVRTPHNPTIMPRAQFKEQWFSDWFVALLEADLSKFSTYIGGFIYCMLHMLFTRYNVTDAKYGSRLFEGCQIEQFAEIIHSSSSSNPQPSVLYSYILIRNEAKALIYNMNPQNQASVYEYFCTELQNMLVHRFLAAIRNAMGVIDQIDREGSENPNANAHELRERISVLRKNIWNQAVVPGKQSPRRHVFVAHYGKSILQSLSSGLGPLVKTPGFSSQRALCGNRKRKQPE